MHRIRKNQFFGVTKNNTVLLILFILFNSCAKAQVSEKIADLSGKWQLEMKHEDLGLTRIYMEFEANKDAAFKAYTRKGAVNDILGTGKALLARTFTNSFKGGSLLNIEKGVYSIDRDTITFSGLLTSAIGNYRIEGIVKDGLLSATLSKNNQIKGSLQGVKTISNSVIQDYRALFDESTKLTQDKIFNKNVLLTEEWKIFEDKMEKISVKLEDDLEFIFAFYYYSGKLPISHYMLMRPLKEVNSGTALDDRQRVFLQEKSAETACLKVTSFEGSAVEMDSVFTVVVNKGYKNLIVDLRGNPGGSVEAGMSFATHVADTTFYGGVFLTQKYFNNHPSLPSVEQYKDFSHFTASNYNLLMDGIHNTEGLCLKVIPEAPRYKGKLFILTNGATASTCEPIVYGLKQRKRAVIVGTATAGAMLAAEMFDLSQGFRLFLPTADYYASDGFRIDKKGVQPDIDTGDTDALQYVLDNLL